MAQEYIYLNESNESGKLALNNDVFKEITNISIGHVEGCYCSSKKEKDNVQIKINDDKLLVNVNVKLKHGININQTCEKLQNKIFLNIFQTTDIKPEVINIKVVGFVNE
ncbi:MAG: Asp23/Gls24 family envelope stress response protein [Erysipelotrichaceae bacterium]|nr:Asp23/Gls24 family envelope stress response protein [Erysipelotrichaceae bacterium]